jgi:hypothetical protein
MPTDTKLKELIINELTEEQYKALTPNDDELYLTPDGSITKNENGSYVFNDGLEVKSNGDVTVGKNLEVDGTAKLNGGLEFIHRYSLNSNDYLNIVFEKTIGYSIYSGFGYLEVNGNLTACIFRYLKSGTTVNIIWAITNDSICTYDGDKLTENIIAKEVNCQSKLFIHTLTLTASDKTYILVYDSTNNLNVDSVADLRTIMKISSSHESEVLPLCSSDMTSTACLKVTTSICQIGTNNVTAVADKVDLK